MTRSNPAAALVCALAIATACGIPSRGSDWQEVGPQLFTTGPYIVVSGPRQALIAMKSDHDEPPVVEWSVEGAVGESTRVTAERDVDLWIATLDDLPISDRIRYTVVTSRGSTEAQSFRIGVPDGESFRFAVFGDTRTGHQVHRAVVEAVAREKIEFYVHTGDMVDRGGIQSQWDLFFQIERPLMVKTPVVPAIGNHDMGARHYFRHYFMHQRWTRGRRYFSHDWGNLRIVVIDGGIECRDGCEQYVFAERALAKGAAEGKMMAMMLHFPPYSSGKHGSHMGVQKSISELARRYGVEVVIAGHDHNYERTKLIDGVTYIVSGSAGAPIRPVKPQWFTAEARTEPHYVLIDVERDRLVMRAVNLRGDTFDTAILRDNPPRPD